MHTYRINEHVSVLNDHRQVDSAHAPGPRPYRAWVHNVDTDRFLQTVRSIQALDAAVVLSSNLPPAIGLGTQLLDMLAAAPATDPFVGPDQQALRQMLASFEPTVAPV